MTPAGLTIDTVIDCYEHKGLSFASPVLIRRPTRQRHCALCLVREPVVLNSGMLESLETLASTWFFIASSCIKVH